LQKITIKYPHEQRNGSEPMMMIGLQMDENEGMDESAILSFFSNDGLSHDDEYLFDGVQRFSYFVAEDANYLIFKEDNDLDFFTDSVMKYLKSLNSGKITVRDEESDEDDGYLFIGSVKEFVKIWDGM